MSQRKRRKRGFVRGVAKGTARGLGKLARGATLGVVGELASILTLGLFKPPRRWR